MSRFKGLSSQYLQGTGFYNTFGAGTNNIASFLFPENSTLYGIRFVLSGGTLIDQQMQLYRISAIDGASSEKIYPFDTYEDFQFTNISGQDIADISFVHPIKVPRGHRVGVIINTSGVDTGTPQYDIQLNYVEDKPF